MDKFTIAAVVLSLTVLIATGGCGGAKVETVEVSGKVTIDGEPIPTGTISFVSADGSVATGGGPIKDGSYTAQVPPGEKIVMVLGNKVVGQEPEYEDVPDSPMRDKYEMITPEEYNAKELSPLKATITESQEGLDFQLTKDVAG